MKRKAFEQNENDQLYWYDLYRNDRRAYVKALYDCWESDEFKSKREFLGEPVLFDIFAEIILKNEDPLETTLYDPQTVCNVFYEETETESWISYKVRHGGLTDEELIEMVAQAGQTVVAHGHFYAYVILKLGGIDDSITLPKAVWSTI